MLCVAHMLKRFLVDARVLTFGMPLPLQDLLLCRWDPDSCSVRAISPAKVWCMQVRLAHERGYMLGNADITIIAQRPKLSPHKEVMRETLCQLLGAHPSVINIKVNQAQKQVGVLHAGCSVPLRSFKVFTSKAVFRDVEAATLGAPAKLADVFWGPPCALCWVAAGQDA